MWWLPSSLRAKLSLVLLLGTMLIPVAASSLRGLTHVLTCSESTGTSFNISIDDEGRSAITSSQASSDPDTFSGELCGGLLVDLELEPPDGGTAPLVLTIANGTEYEWEGSIKLKVDGLTLPISIGRIPAGQTATEIKRVRVHNGETTDISGELLLGP